MIYKLAERGTAGIVLANGSMSSQHSGEGEIRAAMVEADLVACMIALPTQLFRTTQIPACLWFLAKDKSPQGTKNLADRRGQMLFIDAKTMGTMVSKTDRVFTDEEVRKISGAYHAWRGTVSARSVSLNYEDIPGFCYSATIEEARKHGHMLNPGRYVGVSQIDSEDGESASERIERLTRELLGCFDESMRIEKLVRAELGRING